MNISKHVIGVHFVQRYFSIHSEAGNIIDDVIKSNRDKKEFKDIALDRFAHSDKLSNFQIKFSDEKSEHFLIIDSEQIIYTKVSSKEGASINLDKMISEFDLLLKIVSRYIKFPDIRRVGIVGEFHIPAESKDSASQQLMSSLTKFQPSGHTSKFKLHFEDRQYISDNLIPNIETSDFFNFIYGFYPSIDDDEIRIEAMNNANIDVQRYFNPAKSNPIGEIRKLKNKFVEQKHQFKKQLIALGLANDL